MITVSPITNSDEVREYFNNVSIETNDKSGCVAAKSGDEVLGFCLYELNEKGIKILYIEPKDDLSLADGILRSTLHVAASRSAMDARYEGKENEELFSKLSFILNKNEKKLDIDKLFRGCGCKA